jgi:hypothetical protein
MARMRRRGEQPPDLFTAQDLRQFLWLLRERHVKVGPRMAKGHVIEKPEGVGRLTARAPGQLPLEDQVGEVRLDLVVRELIRRSVVVLRQAHHGGDVRRVGAPRETTYGHVADHAGAELTHGTPPWRDERQGGDGASSERRETGTTSNATERRSTPKNARSDRGPIYRVSGLVQRYLS